MRQIFSKVEERTEKKIITKKEIRPYPQNKTNQMRFDPPQRGFETKTRSRFSHAALVHQDRDSLLLGGHVKERRPRVVLGLLLLELVSLLLLQDASEGGVQVAKLPHQVRVHFHLRDEQRGRGRRGWEWEREREKGMGVGEGEGEGDGDGRGRGREECGFIE